MVEKVLSVTDTGKCNYGIVDLGWCAWLLVLVWLRRRAWSLIFGFGLSYRMILGILVWMDLNGWLEITSWLYVV